MNLDQVDATASPWHHIFAMVTATNQYHGVNLIPICSGVRAFARACGFFVFVLFQMLGDEQFQSHYYEQ